MKVCKLCQTSALREELKLGWKYNFTNPYLRRQMEDNDKIHAQADLNPRPENLYLLNMSLV